jgi:peptidyl-prolyl isomerase H (cyclophilin H)
MDINIGETPAGRLKMELFSDIVPKSVGKGSFVDLPHS